MLYKSKAQPQTQMSTSTAINLPSYKLDTRRPYWTQTPVGYIAHTTFFERLPRIESSVKHNKITKLQFEQSTCPTSATESYVVVATILLHTRRVVVSILGMRPNNLTGFSWFP